MKRKDTLREFLKAVFGTHIVKIADDKIYYNDTLFSECEFNLDDYVAYVKLLNIAFLQDLPKMKKPYKDPIAFPREEHKLKFFKYIESYGGKIPSSACDAKLSDYFAYEVSLRILKAIFSSSKCKDKFTIENEDISQAFRKAIVSIERIVIVPDNLACNNNITNNDEIFDDDYAGDSDSFNNGLPIAWNNDEIFDDDYTGDSDSFNYRLPIVLDNDTIPKNVKEPKLKIYVDKSGKYNEKSRFFFNRIVSLLTKYNDPYYLSTINDHNNITEKYLEKELSDTVINYISPSFLFVTHLDEDNILKDYKCTDDFELTRILTDKAIKQYDNILKKQIKEYELSLINYTEDLIKRVISLDLNWLYGDDKKPLDKCNEEISKIIIGYNELHTYYDNCEEDVAVKQYLTILHHAVVEVTNYLNENKVYIASCVVNNDCSEHIKHIKSIANGKTKQLEEFAKDIADSETSEPECLGEAYYYTSSNELMQLLEAIKSYYDSLKNANKKS